MASGSIAAFSPEATVSIAAGTSSNAVALGGSGPSLLVFNSTASIAFLRLGASTSLSATTSDLPIPAGAQLLLTVAATVTAAAVLLSAGSGTVYLTRGSGSAY
ncbi:hypothetical protein ACELLULO517_09195 [Acidisoma cellulosilytica]|uniref:Uncharacterized protein n=1 Tax=Acidisoma cellulosilyticum TaxID=2802395 RepID=A0A963Z0Q0_9PROT|nr:hypothetical protein [Acidisoma cellulosilyticum]MCB8880406.1 hypothetical protein [Acidisoma cellulosilyticum]